MCRPKSSKRKLAEDAQRGIGPHLPPWEVAYCFDWKYVEHIYDKGMDRVSNPWDVYMGFPHLYGDIHQKLNLTRGDELLFCSIYLRMFAS